MTFKDGRFLHVYAQDFPHDGSVITGNKLALLELKRAIDEALKEGESEGNFTASDGEGYELYVVKIEDDEQKLFDSLEMPYVSQYGDTNSHIYYVNGKDDDDLPNPIGYLWERK
ncbi:MAG TPA: hypothetical protein VK105_16295 [Virgibacillus sp.]|nr:hypothetical protein [Virgibacillus sp.]HLR68659.1 hypothetical protein [Virgibacillus sp.]